MQVLGRYSHLVYDQGTGSVNAHLVEVQKVLVQQEKISTDVQYSQPSYSDLCCLSSALVVPL